MGKLLKFRGARDEDSMVRAVLLASMGNRYTLREPQLFSAFAARLLGIT